MVDESAVHTESARSRKAGGACLLSSTEEWPLVFAFLLALPFGVDLSPVCLVRMFRSAGRFWWKSAVVMMRQGWMVGSHALEHDATPR